LLINSQATIKESVGTRIDGGCEHVVLCSPSWISISGRRGLANQRRPFSLSVEISAGLLVESFAGLGGRSAKPLAQPLLARGSWIANFSSAQYYEGRPASLAAPPLEGRSANAEFPSNEGWRVNRGIVRLAIPSSAVQNGHGAIILLDPDPQGTESPCDCAMKHLRNVRRVSKREQDDASNKRWHRGV
jgi:hypothetical protein